MNPDQIREQLEALGVELRDLQALDSLTDDQDRRVDAIVNEINDLGAKLARALTVEQAQRSATAAGEERARLAESRGRVSGLQPLDARAANPAGREQRQNGYRSLSERLFDTDSFRALQAVNGQGVAVLELESFRSEAAAAQMQKRALAHTGILPEGYLEPMRIPGIDRPDDVFGSLRDVLTVGQTDRDAIVFFRENVFTNNAAVVPEGTHTDPGDETPANASLKPESAITFAKGTSDIATIAHWMPITRQMIWNAPEMQTYIDGRLIDGLKMKEDHDLLLGDGDPGNMLGILETSNIQVLDATYFAGAPVANDGEPNENFNRVLRAISEVANIGRAQASFVSLNPADHERFMATADGNARYFGAGPFAAGSVPTLWGKRVVVSEYQPEGRALVGSGTHAIIWDRMAAQLMVGTIDKQFVHNELTLLAEERVGLTVIRPKAFADVTLAAA